jgi:hypothetical protein
MASANEKNLSAGFANPIATRMPPLALPICARSEALGEPGVALLRAAATANLTRQTSRFFNISAGQMMPRINCLLARISGWPKQGVSRQSRRTDSALGFTRVRGQLFPTRARGHSRPTFSAHFAANQLAFFRDRVKLG